MTPQTKLTQTQQQVLDLFMADYRQTTEEWCIGDMMRYLDKQGIDYSHAYADGLDETQTNEIIHGAFKSAYFDNWHSFAKQVYDSIFLEMWRS